MFISHSHIDEKCPSKVERNSARISIIFIFVFFFVKIAKTCRYVVSAPGMMDEGRGDFRQFNKDICHIFYKTKPMTNVSRAAEF